MPDNFNVFVQFCVRYFFFYIVYSIFEPITHITMHSSHNVILAFVCECVGSLAVSLGKKEFYHQN